MTKSSGSVRTTRCFPVVLRSSSAHDPAARSAVLGDSAHTFLGGASPGSSSGPFRVGFHEVTAREMSLQTVFSLAGIVTESVVVGLLVYRSVWRNFPVFLAYCIWALLSDVLVFAIVALAPSRYDLRFYFVDTAFDFAMQLGVLVELAWAVLRPLRVGLSRRAIWMVAALVLAAGGGIWPFAGIPGTDISSRIWHLTVQMQQTASFLRILFFLGLVACSQLLSLGWRDREMQIATGFGFYSLVSVGVAAINSHLATGQQFRQMYAVVATSFLCSLIYWAFNFARPEASRREFTPEIRRILMAIAATARITRAGWVGLPADSSENREVC